MFNLRYRLNIIAAKMDTPVIAEQFYRSEYSKKASLVNRDAFFIDISLYAGNFTGFQSTSTYVYAFWFTVYEDANFLNVHAPSTAVTVVSVGYVVTATSCFTSYITFTSHSYTSYFQKSA
ncbi:hypothetical protein AR543_17385 [Paenibacillus bovis]|uniref:Uncharacterized protein n=1 Tax=Paenibacillus bovis TaxID=1616788 RepID=A0A172ZJ83_9BACL|nr:hypothetical protein AR543_17385 [Paenibacillus bovis]